MSDDELDKWILDYRELVKLAESQLTYRRICLTTAEFEREERKHSAVRKLKLSNEEQERLKITSQKTERKAKPSSTDKLKALAEALVASGLTPELIAKALANVKGGKK